MVNVRTDEAGYGRGLGLMDLQAWESTGEAQAWESPKGKS
jgi:hypothetical protein